MNIVSSIFVSLCCVNALYAFKPQDVHTEVDLTWPYESNTGSWKNNLPFSFGKKLAGKELYGYWYANNDFCVGEHTGTHFDAPYHLNEQGWKVGDVPLFRLMANGITIDLTEETETLKDNARLLPKHILQWERKHGPIPSNAVIMVKFGWAQYYNDKKQYFGLDANNLAHFPGISKEAAELISELENVVGVGVDTASVEPGNSTNERIVHRTLTKNNIYILENVNIPQTFSETKYKLYVMPMYIKEGTGAPARIVAKPSPPHFYTEGSSGLPYYSGLFIVVCLILQLLK